MPLLVITGLSTTITIYWTVIIKGTNFKYTLWAILGGMFGFGRWISNDLIINNPTGYVDILLLCYAVFYFATFVAKRTKTNPSTAYLCTMCLSLVMYHVSTKYSFSMPFFSTYIGRGLLCFFWGLLLRDFLERFELFKQIKWLALRGLYVLGFVYLYIRDAAYVEDYLYYLMSFTVFPCVIILFKAEFLQKICSGRVFSHMSNLTYHSYMWHLTTIYILTSEQLIILPTPLSRLCIFA